MPLYRASWVAGATCHGVTGVGAIGFAYTVPLGELWKLKGGAVVCRTSAVADSLSFLLRLTPPGEPAYDALAFADGGATAIAANRWVHPVAFSPINLRPGTLINVLATVVAGPNCRIYYTLSFERYTGYKGDGTDQALNDP